PAISPINLLFQVRPAVELQDLRVEVLDAEAEAGDAEFLQGLQLVLLESPRLALEGHFRGLLPGHQGLQAGEQATQLSGTQVGWGPAAEVDVVQFPAADDGQSAAQFDFPDERLRIGLDIAGVLVGVDAEIAELAALP